MHGLTGGSWKRSVLAMAMKKNSPPGNRGATHGVVSYRQNTPPRQLSTLLRHAVAKHTFDRLAYFIWWRIVRWVKSKRRWRWTAVHRWLRTPTGWRTITADGIELHNIAATRITR